MRRAMTKALAGAALIGAMGSAGAYSLVITPGSQTVGVGSEVAVSVTAGDLQPDALGSYSFDLSFEGGVLGFGRIVDGLGMGGNAFGLSYSVSGGILSVIDTSLDDAVTLLALQSPSFTLFTVYFDALTEGTSFLSLGNVALADAYGIGAEGVFTSEATVTVQAVSAVPEPGTVPLIALGGLALVWARRRNRQVRSRT